MNGIKLMLFIACNLMMHMAVQGMELERSVANDRIFMWSNEDKVYYALTEQGEISERCRPDNDLKTPKIYKTQLRFKEDSKHLLSTTQEFVYFCTGYKYTNLEKNQRLLVPISLSQEQGQKIQNAFHQFKNNHGYNQERILAMDNEDNIYFITHIYDERADNAKKVKVYDLNEFRDVQVPLLTKKKVMLKINTLEKEVEQIRKSNKFLSIYQKIGIISFAALCAFLLYKHDQLVAFFNH